MNEVILDLFGRPGEIETAGTWLKAQLNNTAWTEFRAIIAFAKSSGVGHIQGDLRSFATRPGVDTRMTVGIDHGGTSLEAMQDLWRLLEGHGSLFAMHQEPSNGQRPTFHPKLYQFRHQDAATVLIGSANLTEGGLFTNYEASVSIHIDHIDPSTQELINNVEAILDVCQTPGPTCKGVDEALLKSLYGRGLLPSEADIELVRSATRAARRATRPVGAPLPPLFGSGDVAPVPARQHVPGGLPPRPVR